MAVVYPEHLGIWTPATLSRDAESAVLGACRSPGQAARRQGALYFDQPRLALMLNVWGSLAGLLRTKHGIRNEPEGMGAP